MAEQPATYHYTPPRADLVQAVVETAVGNMKDGLYTNQMKIMKDLSTLLILIAEIIAAEKNSESGRVS